MDDPVHVYHLPLERIEHEIIFNTNFWKRVSAASGRSAAINVRISVRSDSAAGRRRTSVSG
jgi:hypothetical protein